MIEPGQPAAETQDALVEQGAPQASHRERLARLAREMAANPVECPTHHAFSPGVYARSLDIAAGLVVIGKVHKFENMLILAKGEAEILDGGRPTRVSAGKIWVSPPGTQRAVYAHTDCTFISVHGTDKTDLAEIEEEFIAQDMLAYEQYLLTNAAQGE